MIGKYCEYEYICTPFIVGTYNQVHIFIKYIDNMKQIVILLMLFSCMSLFGQVRYFKDIPAELLNQLDKMGVDDTSVMDSLEGAYLNVSYKDSLNGFDFVGKKVGFILSGSVSDKADFFNSEKERYRISSTASVSVLYVFNEAQKQESGGYDAAIVYWRKFYLPKDKVIKLLKKASDKK
jgi:hypothetical protein